MSPTGRKLPNGIQNFEKIRTEGYLYVDKTDLIWQIANDRQNNFLSRPRRFGKSLLSDVLACYFEGRKELFEGLKITALEESQPNPWPHRAVLRFDFSGKETASDLLKYLNRTLTIYERIYGHDSIDETLNDRLSTLLQNAYKMTGERVAVIVDEYDVPLQHTLFKPDEHERLIEVYRSFFPALKTSDFYLKCLFITGITKFTKLSLFSTLNNISILSTRPEYATLCGFTHQELIDNFMPEIKALGEKKGWTVAETLEALKDMYDGYHFSGDLSPETAVYNPFSVINALDDKDITNYWISTGGSQLLNQMLTQSDNNGGNLDGITMSADIIKTDDVSADDVPLFLYQSGYLTIKGAGTNQFTLGIPNKEVRQALYKVLLPNALEKFIRV